MGSATLLEKTTSTGEMWCTNKFLVMDKLPKEARGSFVWPLLPGQVLKMVEHLRESEYRKEGGEKDIFVILDKRWLERDRTDEMGEDRTFLSRGGERTAVLARTGGDLKHNALTQAMRSIDELWWSGGYANQEMTTEDCGSTEVNGAGFQDVELFLAKHGQGETSDGHDENEVFPETEIAEVLATTWKDRRQEPGRLQRASKFPQGDDLRKTFGVEIEELKKRTVAESRRSFWGAAQAFRKLWTQAGIDQPTAVAKINMFRFGNGVQEISREVIEMPVRVAGRRGLVRAAIMGGEAPLLLSRGALKTLGARMDFSNDELQLFEAEKVSKMETNGTGHYIIPVAEFRRAPD
ncbi:GIP [Symbiodinium microadriaticum]|nr:GIP [Symbiodinium microadriaticum]